MLLVSLILMLLNPPVWLLVAGWRVLPAPLIASEDFEIPRSLRGQLADVQRIDVQQRVAFADFLLQGMYQDKGSRWDRRRGVLLSATIGPAVDMEGILDGRADLGLRHTPLLDLMGCDVVEAAADAANAARYERMSRYPDPLNNLDDHPFFMVCHLVDQATLHAEGLETVPQVADRNLLIKHRTLAMPRTRHLGKEATFSFDRFCEGLLFRVAIDAGFARDHALSFFPPNGEWQDTDEFVFRAARLSETLMTLDSVDPAATDRLKSWCRSDNSSKRGFALMVIGYWCHGAPPDLRPKDVLVEHFIDAAIDALADGATVYTHQDEERTVRNMAQFAILRADRTGARSLPLLRAWLLKDGEFPMHAGYYRFEAGPDLIAAWAEHLSDLAWSDDVEIRRWLAAALPIRTGTPSDARIDEVIARLLTDEDEDIRWDAEYAAELRQEQRAKQTP
jgi:hypothetical protein